MALAPALLGPAGTPDSAHSTFAGNLASVIADNVSEVTLTAAVNDSAGNPVAGQVVMLAASGTGNTFSPSTGKTDASGVFTATLRSKIAEAKQVTASAGALSLSANVTFRAGPISATTTKLTASPNTNVLADGNTVVTLTAQVFDSQRNPISGAQLTLAASGSNNTLAASNGNSDASGNFNTTLKSTKSEVKRITLTAGGVTINSNVTFVPGAPNANATSYVINPNSGVVADNKAVSTLTITARDAYNNTIPGAATSVSSTGTGNTVGAGAGTTNSQGVFTTTLRSTKAEVKAVTLGVGVLTHSGNVTFVPGDAKVPNSTLVATPNAVVADANTTVAVVGLVLDGTNNPITGQAVTFTVSGGNNVISSSSGSTDGNGRFTTSFTSTTAEIKTLTLKAGSAVPTTKVVYTAGSPNAAHSTFLANSNNAVVANGASVVTFTATLRDVKGNPTPNQALTLASSGNNNTFSQSGGNTNAAGVFISNLRSTTAQAKTVTLSGALAATANVTFVAGPAAASTSSVSANPNTGLVADNNAISTLSARFFDPQSNPASGQNVTFSSTGSFNTFGSKTGATDANGAVSTTFKTGKAEAKVITVNAGKASVTANLTFAAGTPNTTASSLALTPNNVIADGTSTVNVTGTVKDALGNGVPSAAVTLALTGNGTLASTGGNTNGSGVYTTTLTSSKAGVKAVRLTSGNVTIDTNVSFIAGSPNVAASSWVVDSNASLVADGNNAFTYTATVRDAKNNPLVGKSVSVTTTGTGNTLSRASGATDANGTFVTTLRSTNAEAKVVTLKAGTASLDANGRFIPGSPNQKTTTLVANPSSAQADGSATVVIAVTVRDALKNVVPNQNVSLAVSGANNTLAGTGGNTDASGNYNTTLKSVHAEPKVVTLTVGGFSLTANVTFHAGSPNATNSNLALTPNSLTANNNDTTAITATLHDALGNPVPRQSVSLTATGSGNKFASASGSTDPNGIFATTLKSSVAQSKQVSLKAGDLTKNANVTFVHGAASATTSTVVATPANSVVANNSNTVSIAVTMLDAQRNPVGGQAITLATSNTNDTLGAQNGNVDANGLLTTTFRTPNAGVHKVTVTAGSVTVSGNVTFVAGSPNATKSVFTAAPNGNIVANGTATSTLTLLVADTLGNPVMNQDVSVASNGNGNQFASTGGKTDATGTFVTTLKSTVAEAKHVTYTAGNVTLSANVTFVVGPPASGSTTLTASPNALPANNANMSTLVATVKDAKGNPITGQAVTLASTGGNNVFGATSGSTDANAQFTTTLKSGKAESKVVTLTAGPATAKASLSFAAGSPNLASSSLVISPNGTVVANDSATATLTARIADSLGNPIAGQAITLNANGSSNTLAASSGTTSATGVFVTTLKSRVAELKSVSVTAGNVTVQQNVTFIHGPPSPQTSTFTVSPNSVLADHNTATTVTATVRDAYNNILANTNVTLSASGTNNAFASLSGATNANGTFVTTLVSGRAEPKTVTLMTLGVSLKGNVTFTAGSPNASQCSVVVAPVSVVADNATTVNVTGTAKDALGNPILNQNISFAVSGSNNTLASTGGNASVAGTYATTLKSSKAELKTVTAPSGGVTVTGNVTFLPGLASSSNSTWVATPNAIVADNANSALLAARLHDVFGNPLGNTKLAVTLSGTGASVTPASGVTNAQGEFNTTLKGSKAETKVATVAVGPTTLNTNVTLRVGSPNATTSSLVVTPSTVVADGNTTAAVTATIRDAFGNLVGSQNVTVSSSGGNNTLGATTGATAPNGIFATTLKSTTAQIKVVTVSGGGVTLSANVTFTAGSPNSALSAMTLTPNAVLADNSNTVAVAVSLIDDHGNAVPNQQVALSANGTLNTFTPAGGKSDTAGTFASKMKSSKAEAKQVTMTAGSLTKSGAVTFQVGPPSRSTSSLVVAPTTSVVANNSNTVALTVTVKDTTGNPVAGLPITLASTGTGNTLASSGGNTGADGNFATTLKTSHAEVKVVTLTAGSLTLTQNVTFVAGSPNTSASSFVINPNAGVVADNKTAAALTARVVDNFNNAVVGLAVTLNANGTGNAFTRSSGAIAADGTFTSALRSSVAETKSVTFSAGNFNVTTNANFVPGPPASTTSTVVLSPNSVNADGNTTMVVTAVLKDAFGNLLPGKSFTLAVSGANNTIASGGSSGTTDGNGTIKTSFTSTHAEDKRVSVVVEGVTLSATGKVLPGSPNAVHSTLVANPATGVAADNSSTSTLTATLLDVFGNPVANRGVTLNSNTNGASMSPTRGNTTTAGVFTARLKSATAGVKVASFVSGNVTLSANVTFAAGAAASSATNLTASPRVGVAADGTAVVNLTATVGDKLDNPVTGATTTFSSSVASDVFTPASGNTDGNGVLTATLKATVGGSRTVTVKSGSASATTTVVFGSTAALQGESPRTMLAALAREFTADVAPEGLRPAQVAMGDLDGDGHLDVAIVLPQAGELRVLLGDGTGGVAEVHSYPTELSPQAVAMADIDGDGIADVLVANGADDSLGVWLGLGEGELSAQRKLSGTAKIAGAQALACGDFAGAGRIDVAVALTEAHDGQIQLLRNLGELQLTPAGSAWAAGSVAALVAGDVDGDGLLDLTAGDASGVKRVLFGRGDGGFAAGVPAGAQAAHVVADKAPVRSLAVGDRSSRFRAAKVAGSSARTAAR